MPKSTLSADERAALAKLESAVEAGVDATLAVIEAGKALTEIRDRQLFRDSGSSWDTYVTERFRITARRANQLIAFAGVKAALDNSGTAVPELSERAARPLVGMNADSIREVVAEAAGSAEGVTPASIRRAASKKKSSKAKVPKEWREKVPGAIVRVALNAKGVKAGVTIEAALAAALEAWRRQHGEDGREAA